MENIRMNLFKKIAAVAGVSLVGVAGMAFANEPVPAKAAQAVKASDKTITIGLVAKSQNNPVFQVARAGAEAGAKELGKEYGVNVKIDWQTPVSEDAQKQADLIKGLIARGVDGIAISATDGSKLKTVVDEAVDNGIAVMTFDSDVAGSKRFAYFGTDDFKAGEALADEIKVALEGKGVIGILAGNPNATNLQSRVRGVRETLAKIAPEISIKNVYYHTETPQDAVKKIEEVQAANPDITGWVFVGGWPLYTQNALNAVRGKAKVVSLDSLPETLGYLRNGDVQVLLGQKYYGWGYESVRLILDNVVKGKVPSSPMVNAPLDRVTKENVDAYAKNWETWLPKDGGKKDEGKK
jgi:ribose transport system substrate-binding protein